MRPLPPAQDDMAGAIPHCNSVGDWSCDAPRLRVAEGGRLLKLRFRLSQAAEWNGEMFYNRGGKRGQCKGFSFGSRRRLLDHLNTVSKGAELPYFLTLTLPDEAFHDSCSELAKRSKVWLATFLKRLARVSPKAAGFWRIEWKARKSGRYEGKLFPHFHLLVWGLEQRKLGERIVEREDGKWLVEDWEAFVDCPDNQLSLQLLDLWSEASKAKADGEWRVRVETSSSGRVFAGSGRFVARAQNLQEVCWLAEQLPGAYPHIEDRARKMAFQDWASLAWYHVVDSHNLAHLQAGVRVERIRSWGGVMSYCAKYLAKADAAFLADVPLGRSWGIFNRAALPWAKIVEIDLDSQVGVRLRRVARHYLERRLGRRVRASYGITLYCDVERFRQLWERPPPDPF